MNNFETISHYEKLHDIFERVSPQTIPHKIQEIILFLQDGQSLFKQQGKKLDLTDVLEVLQEMELAFKASLHRTNRSIILTRSNPNYEVNIYPILNFLRDYGGVKGDLEEVKATLVTLGTAKNIESLKEYYRFIDSICMCLN